MLSCSDSPHYPSPVLATLSVIYTTPSQHTLISTEYGCVSLHNFLLIPAIQGGMTIRKIVVLFPCWFSSSPSTPCRANSTQSVWHSLMEQSRQKNPSHFVLPFLPIFAHSQLAVMPGATQSTSKPANNRRPNLVAPVDICHVLIRPLPRAT